MLDIVYSALPVVVAFYVKMLAVTGLGRLLRKRIGDQIGSWLAAWLVIHALMIAFLLVISPFGLVSKGAIGVFLVMSTALYMRAQRENAEYGFRTSLLLIGMLIPMGVILSVMAFRAFVMSDFTLDAQTYGMVRIAIWMNYRDILVHMPTEQLNIFTNEWNGELINLSYALIAGNIQGAVFGGVEVLLLVFLSATWLAQRLGSTVLWSVVVGTIVAATPACLGLTGLIKGDLLACAAMICAAAALTMIKDKPAIGAALFVAFSALAFGSKISTAFGVLALCILAVALVGRRLWSNEILYGLLAGGLVSLPLVSRNIANLFIYGSPFKRVPGEAAAPGIDTFLAGIPFISAQSFRFSIVVPGQEPLGWFMSAGLGLTAFFAIAVAVVGGKPERMRVLLAVASLLAIAATAFLIPIYPWSYRYFLPMVLVVIVALMAVPMRSKALMVVACAAALVVFDNNGNYVFWPGEINGNNSFEATLAKSQKLTPLNRLLISADVLRDPLGIDDIGYDRDTPLSFAILDRLNQPISPYIGSRAQNRLYLASNMGELIASVQSNCVNIVVITKGATDQFSASDRTAIEAMGYTFQKNNPIANIAQRTVPQCPATGRQI